VQEFKVITNGLSAEFGRTGGGVITAATAPAATASRQRLRLHPPRPVQRQQLDQQAEPLARGSSTSTTTASRSAPIVKDRTFFFVNVERSKNLSPDN